MMRRAVRRVVYGRTETGRDVDFFGGEAVSVPAAQCLEIDLASQGETKEELSQTHAKRWNCTSSHPLPHTRDWTAGFEKSAKRKSRQVRTRVRGADQYGDVAGGRESLRPT